MDDWDLHAAHTTFQAAIREIALEIVAHVFTTECESIRAAMAPKPQRRTQMIENEPEQAPAPETYTPPVQAVLPFPLRKSDNVTIGSTWARRDRMTQARTVFEVNATHVVLTGGRTRHTKVAIADFVQRWRAVP